jgi:AmiR/NasT family two-component response regulator
VVLLTHIGDGITRDAALRSGASAHLVLPAHRDVLVPALVAAVMRGRLMEALSTETHDLEEREEIRALTERAVGIMVRRWSVNEGEALRQFLLRARQRDQSLRQTAMEIIGEGLFD